MRTYVQIMKHAVGASVALAGVLTANWLGATNAVHENDQSSLAAVTVGSGGGGGGSSSRAVASGPDALVISTIEPTSGEPRSASKDRSWLGVSIEEGSEALASQLGLAPGAGLVVTYVTPDSPAAKAGLEKNDVLVKLEGQLLVHPAQLRKLIQVRTEGDTIELVFYRAGKKQTASATLSQAPAGVNLLDEGSLWKGEWQPFRSDAFHDWPKALRDSLGNLKFDQKKVEEEVRRSLDQARKAWGNLPLRGHFTNSFWHWAPATKALGELRRSGIEVDNDASVTVRSTSQQVKSIVKADESGTVVLVCNPKPRLTAHDKDGKLLFDGEIDTPEQRAKVPAELWEKVEPLLDKMAPRAEEEETEPARSKKPSSPDRRSSSPARPRPAPTL